MTGALTSSAVSASESSECWAGRPCHTGSANHEPGIFRVNITRCPLTVAHIEGFARLRARGLLPNYLWMMVEGW